MTWYMETAQRAADWHISRMQEFLEKEGDLGIVMASAVIDKNTLVEPVYFSGSEPKCMANLFSVVRELSMENPAVFFMMDSKVVEESEVKDNVSLTQNKTVNAIMGVILTPEGAMVRKLPYTQLGPDGKFTFQDSGWNKVDGFNGPGGGNPYSETLKYLLCFPLFYKRQE